MWKQKTDKKVSTGSLIFDIPIFSTLEKGKEFSDFPYSLIITQACDLASYYKAIQKKSETPSNNYNRQLITQTLLLPAFDEESFKNGTHLKKQYDKTLSNIEADVFKGIQEGKDFRYHYIKSEIQSIPSLIIDFKHYFTVPIEIVVEVLDRSDTQLYDLEFKYYTDIADRFAHYLQRVAV